MRHKCCSAWVAASPSGGSGPQGQAHEEAEGRVFNQASMAAHRSWKRRRFLRPLSPLPQMEGRQRRTVIARRRRGPWAYTVCGDEGESEAIPRFSLFPSFFHSLFHRLARRQRRSGLPRRQRWRWQGPAPGRREQGGRSWCRQDEEEEVEENLWETGGNVRASCTSSTLSVVLILFRIKW